MMCIDICIYIYRYMLCLYMQSAVCFKWVFLLGPRTHRCHDSAVRVFPWLVLVGNLSPWGWCWWTMAVLHCMLSNQNDPPLKRSQRGWKFILLKIGGLERWFDFWKPPFLEASLVYIFQRANLLALFLGRGYAKFEHVQINKAAGNS